MVISSLQTAEVANEAFKTGKTVREVCLEWNVLPPEQFAEVLDPMRMTGVPAKTESGASDTEPEA